MKRKIKIKILLMSCIATLITICLSNTVFAESTTIQYNGKITYGASTVGSFYVDGRRAFCMDHNKTSPSNGTSAETSIYSDPNVVKCLYYGWEGVEVWSGFNGDSNYGIVATTLALDHYVNGSNKTVAKDFIAFLDSASVPEDSLDFTKKELNASIQDGKQVTEQTKITGTSGITLKFAIPNDVTVVCDNGNWSKTGGTIEVSNGDIIHFEAPIIKTGNWISSQIPNSYVLNAVLTRTNNPELQRLVRIGEKDPTTYTNISINFVKTGDVKIHKEDRNTKKSLSGAKFNIYRDINENGKLDDEDKIVYHTVTKEDGYSEDIELEYGTYFVKEVVAPEGYTLDHIINTFSVTELNQKIEVNFADKIIENSVEITKNSNNDSIKYGINKGEGIPDTYFALYTIDKKGNIIDFAKDKFGKYIGEKITINGKEYYSIKTDENGKAKVTVPYGKYLFKEIKSHDLFLNDSEDKIIDVLDDGKQVTIEFFDTAVNLELDISKTGVNQAQPNDIIKYDFPTIINKSNVALDNFTWWDHLPSKYVKITKLYTGIWNEELNFKVYYKTNKNDYKQYGLEYSTLANNCIDFEVLGLNNEDDEYITDFKIVFGTVKSGFTFIEAPFIFTKVDSDIKTTDEWTNKTKLTGQYTDENGNVVELEDNDEHTTTTYGKELKIATLPRTGNNLGVVTYIMRGLAIIIIVGMAFLLIKK